MGSVKVEKFGGQLPAWDARFLPDDQAAASRDTYLYSGAAIGWRVPTLLRALTNSVAKFAYRIPVITQGVAGASLTVIAPIAGDTVTIGEITYTFRAIPTNPYDVLLGATAALSAEALFMAINFGSYDTTVVGNNTPANPGAAGAAPVLGFPYPFSGTTNTPGANTIVLVPVTPTVTMQINDVSLMPGGTSGAANFTGVVYDSVNQINAAGTEYVNIPSSLLATGATVTGCVTGQALMSALPVPVTLQGGSTYFIGFIMDTAIPLALSSTGLDAVSNANTYASGPPNPFQTTELSGVTTGGTTVGTLQTPYNSGQPNWQIWGAMSVLTSSDPIDTITGAVISVQAPSFGTAYNLTPVAESTAGVRLSWGTAVSYSGGANRSADTTITGNSAWLEFLDQDTNVCRTPVVDDSFQRYYWASPSQPPMYNTYDRIAAAQPAFILGVPAPPIAPTLAIAGGGNPAQIGFPGSSNSNTQTFTQPGNNGITIIVYPMQSSVGVTLNDISFQLAGFTTGLPTGGVVAQINGVIFADGANVSGGTAGTPSDLIGECDNVQIFAGDTTVPGPQISANADGINLNANQQYWIGIMITEIDGGSSISLQFSDTATKGYSAEIAPINTLLTLPTNPTTGDFTSPPLAANYPDLQVWADLTPGSTGEAQIETRGYAYTWVTAYGEEGPPSPPALLDGYDNATWTIGLQPPLPEDMGVLRDIVRVNIYRTMSSVQGGTVFFYVGTMAASANETTFVDQVTDDVVATNLILPSTTWFAPPTTLQGIITMPNGMIAGFVDNEVWFCEPFRPHAWPAGYVLTTDYPIVGLGVVGTTLVATTQATPNVFIGTAPSAMTQQRIPLPEPCTSRGGILSTENGVYYPSVNGLVKVAAAGFANNMTQSWITREKWDALVPQKFIRAVKNVSTYFAFGTTGITNGQPDTSVAQEGFTIELSEVADQQSFTLWPQVGGHRIGFSNLSAPNGANIDNVLSDPWSGVTLLIAGENVYYYDFTNPAPIIKSALWRSKKFQGPHKDNFAAFRVWFDIPPGGPQTPPATRTTVPFTENPPAVARLAYAPGMFGVVRIIADDKYVTERELRYSTELMRVSSQSKYTTWQIELEGVVSVTNVKMATTVKELGLMKV